MKTTKKPHGQTYYVTPHKDGWAVRCELNSSVAYSYDNKEKAITTARFLAKQNRAGLVIQERDGSVLSEVSY